MALQKILSLLLVLLLTVLGLGLVQPSHGQDPRYGRFLRQHVDRRSTGGDDSYCNIMMRRRGMTTHDCKSFNTFIHDDINDILKICNTPNILCKKDKRGIQQNNCHRGTATVTDCRESGSSRFPNCRYRARASTRRIVIACEGDPEVPVHFDS